MGENIAGFSLQYICLSGGLANCSLSRRRGATGSGRTALDSAGRLSDARDAVLQRGGFFRVLVCLRAGIYSAVRRAVSHRESRSAGGPGGLFNDCSGQCNPDDMRVSRRAAEPDASAALFSAGYSYGGGYRRFFKCPYSVSLFVRKDLLLWIAITGKLSCRAPLKKP